MADLVVTAANVVAGTGATTKTGTAGATITAGQLVYLDSADSKYKLIDADAAATADIAGVALNGASNTQPISILTAGALNPGATVAVGTVYCGAVTPGGIAPVADLIAGDYISVLGIGTTASNILVAINNSQIAKA